MVGPTFGYRGFDAPKQRVLLRPGAYDIALNLSLNFYTQWRVLLQFHQINGTNIPGRYAALRPRNIGGPVLAESSGSLSFCSPPGRGGRHLSRLAHKLDCSSGCRLRAGGGKGSFAAAGRGCLWLPILLQLPPRPCLRMLFAAAGWGPAKCAGRQSKCKRGG